MASNVTIAYLADVTDLRTKAALAKVALADVNAAVKEQASGFAALSDEAKGPALAALQAMTAEQARLQAAVRAGTTALKEHGAAHGALGSILNNNRSAFMEAEHVVRSFADGIASGASPMRLLAQEGGRVVQLLTNLNGIGIASIAGWGAMGAGILGAAGALIYFSEQAQQANRDAHELQSVFSAGNFQAPQSEILAWGYDLKAFGDLTEAESRKVIAVLGQMRGRTVESVQAMIDVLPLFAKRLGVDIPTAANEMVRVLGDVNKEGARFLAQINASADVQNQFQQALARTDGSSFGIVLQELTRQALAFGDAEKYAIAQASSLSRASFSPSNKAGGAGQETYNLRLQAERAQKAVQDVAAALKAADSQPGTIGLEAFRLKAQQVSEDITKTASQKTAAIASIWDKAVSSGRLVGEELTQAEREQASARVAAATSESAQIIRLAQITAERRAAAAGPNRAGQVQAEIATYQETLRNAHITADAKEELENRIAELQVQLVRRVASEGKKSTEEDWRNFSAAQQQKIEAARGDFAEQTRLAQQWVAEGRALFGQNVANYREASQQVLAIAKAEQEQKLALEREQLSFDKEMASIGSSSSAGEFKVRIGLIFDGSDLAAKVQAQIAAATQGAEAELKVLSDEMDAALNNHDAVGYQRAVDQSLLVQAKLADQVASIQQKAAQATEAAWAKVTGPIDNALGGIVDAALKGGRHIGQDMERVAAGMVASYAKMAAQAIFHEAAKQLGLTAATTAGETARLGVQSQAAVAGQAIQKSAAVSSITVDAGKAAAGAYAAVADIPIIGPVIAPAAAAVAYGAVLAFESFDVGTMNVPQDMLANIHKGEIIIPAAQAAEVRTAAGGGSGAFPAGLGSALAGGLRAPALASAGSGGTSTISSSRGGDTHVSYAPTINHYGDGDNLEAMLERHSDAIMSRINSSYGNGQAVTLPGRTVRR